MRNKKKNESKKSWIFGLEKKGNGGMTVVFQCQKSCQVDLDVSVPFQRAEQSSVDGREMDAGMIEESKIGQINLCNKLLNFDSFVINKNFISCFCSGSMGMFLVGSLLQLSSSGGAGTKIPSKQTMSLRAPWSLPVCPLFGERTRKKDSCGSSRLMYQTQKWCMSF